MGALQELLRSHGAQYLERFGQAMPQNHRKVLGALMACRTEASGTILYQCEQCGEPHVAARCCGNRHCPGCQGHKAFAWLGRQLERELPTPYFLLTFTVPEALRGFLRAHQRIGYGALFEASSGAIKKLAPDPKYLGADTPGFFGVLHTWGRCLQYHPHIHYVAPGGAIDTRNRRWRAASPGFYLPVRALSVIYRAKFRDLMAKAGLIAQIPPEVWRIDWNVNCQSVGSAETTLRYLSRYVFKVAISEQRILSIDEGQVRFRYRKVHSNRPRVMALPAMEFMRRFLQHVLPSGFMKVRYYGFLSPSFSMPPEELRARIEMAHAFTARSPGVKLKPPSTLCCRYCGAPLRFRRVIQAPRPFASAPIAPSVRTDVPVHVAPGSG